MSKIHLIHWQKGESEKYAFELKQAGHDVDFTLPSNAQFFKSIRANPPDVMIIDLSRLPSQGRDIAINLRSQKSIQKIPVIFVEGDSQKIADIQQIIPDALYTHWDNIEAALKQIFLNPPQIIKQDSVFSVYANTPLLKKLTIQQNMRICLINSPVDFVNQLGVLPENVSFLYELDPNCQLIIWFVTQTAELDSFLPEIANVCQKTKSRLWICWQKKAKATAGEVTQYMVREKGLALGLVDYKICSIDPIWSGLLFRWRGIKVPNF